MPSHISGIPGGPTASQTAVPSAAHVVHRLHTILTSNAIVAETESFVDATIAIIISLVAAFFQHKLWISDTSRPHHLRCNASVGPDATVSVDLAESTRSSKSSSVWPSQSLSTASQSSAAAGAGSILHSRHSPQIYKVIVNLNMRRPRPYTGRHQDPHRFHRHNRYPAVHRSNSGCPATIGQTVPEPSSAQTVITSLRQAPRRLRMDYRGQQILRPSLHHSHCLTILVACRQSRRVTESL